jgi:hypothetical protein
VFFTAGGQAPPGRPRPPSLASLMSSDCPLRNPCLRPAMWGEVSDAMRGGCPRVVHSGRNARECGGTLPTPSLAEVGFRPWDIIRKMVNTRPLFLKRGACFGAGSGQASALWLWRASARIGTAVPARVDGGSHTLGTASDFLEGQAFGVLSGQAFGVQFGGVMYCLGSSLARSRCRPFLCLALNLPPPVSGGEERSSCLG